MKNLIHLFLIIVPLVTYGTAQSSEKLTYKGKSVPLRETPLSTYLRLTQQAPNFEEYFGFSSSACWRGYVGTWHIEDGKLFLIKIQDCEKKRDYPLEDLFPGYNGERIFASWYSGYLEIPRGAELHYVHMGFDSVYEDNILLQVDSGRIVKKEVLSQRAVAYLSLFHAGKKELKNFKIQDLSLKESLVKVIDDFNIKLSEKEKKSGLDKVKVSILPKELPDKKINIELSEEEVGIEFMRFDHFGMINLICQSAGYEPFFSHRGDTAIIKLKKIQERIVEEDDPENKEVIANSEYLQYLMKEFDVRNPRMSGYSFNDKNARWRADLYSTKSDNINFHIDLEYMGKDMFILDKKRPERNEIYSIVNNILEHPVVKELWSNSSKPEIWIRRHPKFIDDDDGQLSNKTLKDFAEAGYTLPDTDDWSSIQIKMREQSDWIAFWYSQKLKLVIFNSAYLSGEEYKKFHHIFPIDPFERGLSLFKKRVIIDDKYDAKVIKEE